MLRSKLLCFDYKRFCHISHHFKSWNSKLNNQDHDRSLGKIHENAELLRQVLRSDFCVLAAYQCVY